MLVALVRRPGCCDSAAVGPRLVGPRLAARSATARRMASRASGPSRSSTMAARGSGAEHTATTRARRVEPKGGCFPTPRVDGDLSAMCRGHRVRHAHAEDLWLGNKMPSLSSQGDARAMWAGAARVCGYIGIFFLGLDRGAIASTNHLPKKIPRKTSRIAITIAPSDVVVLQRFRVLAGACQRHGVGGLKKNAIHHHHGDAAEPRGFPDGGAARSLCF